MTFHTEVVGCYWQESTGEWLVKLREHLPGQEPREFEDRCHILLYGAGVLNNFEVSDIPYCSPPLLCRSSSSQLFLNREAERLILVVCSGQIFEAFTIHSRAESSILRAGRMTMEKTNGPTTVLPL